MILRNFIFCLLVNALAYEEERCLYLGRQIYQITKIIQKNNDKLNFKDNLEEILNESTLATFIVKIFESKVQKLDKFRNSVETEFWNQVK